MAKQGKKSPIGQRKEKSQKITHNTMNDNKQEKIIFILSILNVAISAVIAYLQKQQVNNEEGNQE